MAGGRRAPHGGRKKEDFGQDLAGFSGRSVSFRYKELAETQSLFSVVLRALRVQGDIGAAAPGVELVVVVLDGRHRRLGARQRRRPQRRRLRCLGRRARPNFVAEGIFREIREFSL